MIKEIIIHTINTDRKNIKNYILGLGIMFAFFSICFSSFYEIDGVAQLSYSNTTGLIQFMLLALFMFASPNWVFRFQATRPTTIQYLMLPASNWEKFFSKLLFSYAGYFLMCLIALIGADIVQAIYHLVIYHQADSITLLLLKENNLVFVTGMYKELPKYIALAIWVHSIYTLGASFFRRHSFIKTSGIMFLLTVFFMGITSAGMISTILNSSEVTIHFFMDPELLMDIIFYSVLAALAFLNYWLAYRRFCKITVVV